ncbi:hypothetical protein [Brevibacillus fortis]|uniref:hypothetical protein n=1 Tax=Brevibacillus fortis TaxID=2126352 RepID=UPI0038FCC3E6
MKKLALLSLSIFSVFTIISSASAATPKPVAEASVNAQVTVTKLEIEADIPRVFYPGNTAPVWVTAHFSDGTSKLVSNDAKVIQQSAGFYISRPGFKYGILEAARLGEGWITFEYGGVQKSLYFTVANK